MSALNQFEWYMGLDANTDDSATTQKLPSPEADAAETTGNGYTLSTTEPTPASRITVDPKVRGGVPCVGSGNWPITFILEGFAEGKTPDQIVQDFPGLTLADIQLALKAAAWVMQDAVIDWEEYNLPAMLDFQDELKAWEALSDEALNSIENPSEE